MLRPEELIVDNFAGGGGASTGIFMATGRDPDIAINHDPEALAMHRANHPGTHHLREDVFAVDPVKLCAGRPVGLAWFSPDCKHFSKAKGGQPVSKKIRGLAWVVVKWAAAVKPRIICLENVEEFQTWGPLDADGKPCKRRQGVTFRFWWRKLEKLGYKIEMRELRACDYGVPTIRKRLFIVARCDGLPIVWPQQTHGDPKTEAVKSGRLKPWRTAAECIDWSLPCPSIFERERPLAENTMKRIARGIQRYVIDAKEPFIVTCNHGGDWFRGHGTTDPMNTITASRDAHGLVVPVLGGVGGRAGQSRERSGDEPLQTLTAKGDTAIITPFLTECANSSTQRNFDVDDPLRTQCGEIKGGHFAMVSPYLIPRYGEREGQEPRCASVENPVPTIVPTQNGAQLVTAFMAQHNGGPRNENSTGREAEAPLSTITHRGTQQQIVTANLARHMKNSVGPELGAPASTVMTKEKDSLVTSHLIKLKGTCQHGQETDKPAPTVQASGLHVGEVRAFLIEYYSQGSGKTGAPMNKPAPTVTANDRLGLVTIKGVDYQIVDIGMRMLQPRELYRAQGFDDSYTIAFEYNGKPLSKSSQVRMCGNSVCPPLAAAIVTSQLAAGEAESTAAAL